MASLSASRAVSGAVAPASSLGAALAAGGVA
jgi:hypothetical protein